MSKKTGNNNILKVIRLELEDRVYNEMKKKDFSVEALTREINAEGTNISAQSIRKFIKNTKQAQHELIQKDMRFSKEIMKTAMDYNKELRSILTEVQEVKEQAKNDKDFTTYNQLIGRLLQGIELFAKLTGDMKTKGNVDVKIIYNQISDNIENNMQDLKNDIFKGMNSLDVDFEVMAEDKEAVKIIKEEDNN